MKLTEHAIKGIFDRAENQEDYVINLYRIAIPHFSKTKEIHGFPQVSRPTNLCITDLAIRFDVKHHPDLFSGGLWLNKGFSNADLPDWTVETCKVKY